ncbi:hypothetical protein Cfor_06611, partial [Coptotermes formosanus]
DYAYTRSNFAFSPYGVASVLVVLYEGARGESARQIHNTLRLPWNVDVTRIGFRDIHRHLRGYFSHEGYLSGLTLNKNHTSLLPEYRRVLRFYGYDVGLAPGNTFPPTTSTSTTTTTTTTTTATTTSTTTIALPVTEPVQDPDTTTGQGSIPPTLTSPEAAFTLITLNIPRESTTSPKPSGDDIATAGDSTTVLASDTASGNEQASSLLPESITSPVLPMDDEGVTTPAEITSTAVLGEIPEESAPTVPQETREQQTQTAEPPEQPTELTAVTEQLTEMVAGTEKPTEIMALTEETTETVTLTEQQTETVAPTEQPTETVSPTEQPTETVAPTEQPTETVSPTGTVLQTVQATETVAQTEQTETGVPTEEPTGTETLTDEQTETETSAEVVTEKMTVLPETNIIDYTIPDNVTEQVVSMETDTGKSTIPDRNVLIQSTNRISEPRTIISTPLPLTHNLVYQTQHENSTLVPSNRTRKSIEDGAIVFPDISLQLQNGMFDSQLSRGYELYNQLPKRPFLIDGVSEELVPVMSYTAIFRFAYLQRLHAQALEFPLDDERYKLLLLLPVERRGLRQLIYDLTSCSLREIYQALRPTRVQAIIPSFMVEGFVILTPTLQQLGIWDVFDPRRADLSGMSDDPELYVRNIEQSVTVVIRNYVKILDIQTRTMAARATTERFVVAHPFLYFVLDTDTHVTLMAGKIVDPLNSRIY